MRFEDKVVIVTGGGKGLGKAISLTFAEKGAKVVIAEISINSANKVAREIKSLNQDCLVVRTDASNREEICNMTAIVKDKFNNIDILVNNAGAYLAAPVVDTSEKDWQRIIDVNLKGVFLCSQVVAKEMIKQGSGKIINISSMAGKTGPTREGAYAASKSAVIALTKTLSKELAAYGINVNAICPGLINTEMLRSWWRQRSTDKGISFQEVEKEFLSKIPLGRVGMPKDIANLVLFLASEEASYITGESINITGGFPAI